MTRIRYTMPARSQGKLYAQQALACLAEKDIHRWVFAYNMAPDVESLVRKWLTARLDGFYCDLQVMYMPHVVGPVLARTHIVLNNAHVAPRDAVKALVKATGLNPHLSVFGWPFCVDDVDDVNDAEVGAV